jgi:hypothetical protein
MAGNAYQELADLASRPHMGKSLWLDIADKLAAYFGLHLVKRKKRNVHP